jgi:filamentous hemagglutinin family protein
MQYRATFRLAACLALLLPAAPAAFAEVVLDGSVGSRGRLTLNGQDVRITPDMGTTRGGNLFHSFDKFGVPKGDAVTFEGPASVQRVIGRVTGPEASQIHGTLRSTLPNASLWLLNPNGLVVGKDAAIDVPGSLRLSTADELRFSDGSVFSARDIPGSSLTAADPRAFGFLGGPVGKLSVEAPALSLGAIDAGTGVFRPGSLGLVGGEVVVNGTKIEVNGPILIAAQAGAGEVPLVAPATARDGKVVIAGGASISAILLAGSIMRIEGGEFSLTDASILPVALVEDNPAVPATGLDLAARSVILRADAADDVGILAFALGGKSPDVSIKADQVTVEGAALGSTPFIGSAAGNLTVVADRVLLSKGAEVGTPALTASSAGAGGQTTIVARSDLSLVDGAQINSTTASSLDGGNVVLVVGNLNVVDSLISTSNAKDGVLGAGKAGSIVINASGKVLVSGNSLINAFTANATDSGVIAVRADSITISEGGQITTASLAGGDAGDIALTARSVTIGQDGAVDAQALGTGEAGEILVRADQDLVLDGGAISTSSLAGSGGAIIIEAGQRVILQNVGLILTAIFGDGTGTKAGGITISGTEQANTHNVVLDATSGISATAFNVGDGGTIQIATDGLIARPGQIDASAREGNAGTVASTSPQTNIVSSFAGLDAQVAPADRLLASSCDAREVASSLVVGAVRGGEHAFDPDRPFGSPEGGAGCRN